MNQPEFNGNDFPFSNNSYECAPCYNNESLFFNLILNTKYENTKENCLIFFRNYSRNIILSKRDLFKNIINELTLSQLSNKTLDNNNSTESIYLIRTCIKNYSRNNIINALYDFISEDNNNNINNNIQNINSKNYELNNNNDNVIKIEENNEEIKENSDEEYILNQSLMNHSSNKKKKNVIFLCRKRKFDISRENNENNKNINGKKSKIKEKKENKEKKKEIFNIKKEKFDEDDDIINISDKNVKIKQEKDDYFKKSFYFEEKDEYKNRLRRRNKSQRIESISKRSSPSLNHHSQSRKKKFSLSPEKKKHSEQNKENKNNKNKMKKNNLIKLEEKNLRSHIIKINGNVVSYKMMKFQSPNAKKINFLCNNDDCRGKGVYLIDKKIFKETEKHNFKKIHHVIAPKNKNIRDLLLKEKNCDGYQILKNGEFIKDKKVVYL